MYDDDVVLLDESVVDVVFDESLLDEDVDELVDVVEFVLFVVEFDLLSDITETVASPADEINAITPIVISILSFLVILIEYNY